MKKTKKFTFPFIPPKRLSRRKMLVGGAAAISLPMMDAMAASAFSGSIASGNSAPPVRLCYLYFPNGAVPQSWEPQSVDANNNLLKLGKWMSPLEKHKDKLLLLRNAWTPRGNGHGAGTATWLTDGGYNARKISAGVSVDQLAAKSLGKETMIPSIELSMEGEGFFSNSLPRNTISWNEKGNPIPRETEPRSVFDRMFRAGQSGAHDQSTIDLALEEIKGLKKVVGADDNRKLDEYVDAIRGVERKLETGKKNAESTKKNPELKKFLNRPESGIPTDHGEYMRLMYDMLVLGFWSDATRVSTFMLDHGQSNRYFNFIDGVKGTWHAISHWRDTSGKTEDDDGVHSWKDREEKLAMYNRIVEWHHQQFAYFLDRLSSIKEPNGTLLHNCGIVYGSSLSDGHEHGARNLPIIVAGNAGGKVDPGRMLKFKRSTSLSGIHQSLLDAANVPRQKFASSAEPIELNR